MKQQICNMIYDSERERWVVDMRGNQFGLHCGECFELSIGGIKIPCRLEYGSEWYVLTNGVRFNLHPQETYRVKI